MIILFLFVHNTNGGIMKYKSIWESNLNNNIRKNKKFDEIKTDVLIIGAGITGITSAYFLMNSNKKSIVIDKGIAGDGISAKTTAKITYLQQDVYSKLSKMHGIDVAKKYYNSQKDAINIIKRIIDENNIECDFENVSSVIFTNDDINAKKIEKEKEILLSWNNKVNDYTDEFIKYGLIVDDTYVFNPIKYLNSLRKIIEKKIPIYENTMATGIKKKDNFYIVNTNNGKIITKDIVVACHYPFFIIPHFFPFKTYIEREYVCASTIDNPKKIALINIDKELYSVRYYKNYLIYVSNDHRLTSKTNYHENYQKSINDFKKYFNKDPEYIWMNQDIISNDRLPFIGKIKNNLYIASAYNAWGISNGTIGGKIVADLIMDKDNEYRQIFNPNRINMSLVINSFIGIFHYLRVYFLGLFKRNNPYYVKIKGIIYGIYKDDEGITHKIKLICPHMKCALLFNQKEKTWDCPCHGSRFDLDGNIIETPSVKKL